MYQIGNAPLRPYPFPHFYVDDVLPPDLFARLRDHLPSDESYQPIGETGRVTGADGSRVSAYPERFVMNLRPDRLDGLSDEQRAVWAPFADMLFSADFSMFVLSKFDVQLRQRFGDKLNRLQFHTNAQLLRDVTNYHLGPHSDHPSKVAVLLFYFAADDAGEHLGTSVYLARDPAAHADKGEHFHRDQFWRAATMPYRPNRATGFFKTPNSFHGVERVTGPAEQRDLLQFAISYSEPSA